MNKKRQKIYDKYNGKCAYCGCKLNGKFQVDHLISQSNFIFCIKNKYEIPECVQHLTENDLNHIDNLMPACASCNLYKNNMTLETFRKQLGFLVERLNKRIVIYKIAKRFGLIHETNNKIKFYFETKEGENE